MVKYREYVQSMLEKYQDIFDRFQKIHDCFALDPKTYRNKFNREGKKVVDIIREYEDRLCATSEKGQFSKYSATLAQKFQEEVRRHFPKIDHVGVVTVSESPQIDMASLKKISPHHK